MRRATEISAALDVDELMRYAVELTRDTYPHPNPRVGAIIVSEDGTVLATGACHGDGEPHAEVNALNALPVGTTARGATAVITLEPCSHQGRTPPCADALIDAGIRCVVVGAVDPDPRVSGSGVAKLRAAGVEVIEGVQSSAVRAADPHYFHQRRTGRPYVTLKLASTLDGQVAAADGTSQWITSELAREDAHRLRGAHDAVLVGAGTAVTDDPSLTVRLSDHTGPQPRPVVLVGDRKLPHDLRLMDRNPLIVGADASGSVDIGAALDLMASDGILGVLVEGGPRVARSFLDAGAVDRVVWYIGGVIAGGTGMPAIGGEFATLADIRRVDMHTVTRLGPDIRIDADLITEAV